MNNPILLSESFERAALSLCSAFEMFNRNNFDESVRLFCRSVDKLQAILGMQAENDQRKAVGASMAYTEDAFAGIQ